ncbi:MAG: TIM44-like domain-containing protein [Candidatus Dormibacteraeota bacterium]|nr:TIM44-like domain-containing protein [Candidatus Dormibacteraeota bacterium]
MAFLLVQRAYQDRNVPAARAFLAAPVWSSWSEQVNYLREQRQRPILENLNVRGLAATDARAEESGQSVTVHIDYVAAIHFNDDRDGRLISGSEEDARLGEDWTFWRGPGTLTVQDGGATASKCPNCGGLLKLNDDGKCDYCGADIQSGSYDWVVTDMQRSSFQGVSTARGLGFDELAPERGLAAIQATDPAFDFEQFRGRGEQAFYSLQEAWQARDLGSSRPFMSPGLYLGWSSQVQQLIELHKINKLDGLRLDELIPIKVTSGQAFDEITVRVTATCADYEVDERTGKVIFGSHSPSRFSEFWTFQRGRGVQTTNRSLQDRVCPNCGAPLEINQVGECRYCRAAVTSGRFDWVLSRIEETDGDA